MIQMAPSLAVQFPRCVAMQPRIQKSGRNVSRRFPEPTGSEREVTRTTACGGLGIALCQNRGMRAEHVEPTVIEYPGTGSHRGIQRQPDEMMAHPAKARQTRSPRSATTIGTICVRWSILN